MRWVPFFVLCVCTVLREGIGIVALVRLLETRDAGPMCFDNRLFRQVSEPFQGVDPADRRDWWLFLEL